MIKNRGLGAHTKLSLAAIGSVLFAATLGLTIPAGSWLGTHPRSTDFLGSTQRDRYVEVWLLGCREASYLTSAPRQLPHALVRSSSSGSYRTIAPSRAVPSRAFHPLSGSAAQSFKQQLANETHRLDGNAPFLPGRRSQRFRAPTVAASEHHEVGQRGYPVGLERPLCVAVSVAVGSRFQAVSSKDRTPPKRDLRSRTPTGPFSWDASEARGVPECAHDRTLSEILRTDAT